MCFRYSHTCAVILLAVVYIFSRSHLPYLAFHKSREFLVLTKPTLYIIIFPFYELERDFLPLLGVPSVPNIFEELDDLMGLSELLLVGRRRCQRARKT